MENWSINARSASAAEKHIPIPYIVPSTAPGGSSSTGGIIVKYGLGRLIQGATISIYEAISIMKGEFAFSVVNPHKEARSTTSLSLSRISGCFTFIVKI